MDADLVLVRFNGEFEECAVRVVENILPVLGTRRHLLRRIRKHFPRLASKWAEWADLYEAEPSLHVALPKDKRRPIRQIQLLMNGASEAVVRRVCALCREQSWTAVVRDGPPIKFLDLDNPLDRGKPIGRFDAPQFVAEMKLLLVRARSRARRKLVNREILFVDILTDADSAESWLSIDVYQGSVEQKYELDDFAYPFFARVTHKSFDREWESQSQQRCWRVLRPALGKVRRLVPRALAGLRLHPRAMLTLSGLDRRTSIGKPRRGGRTRT